MNVAILMGRLTDEPDIRTTQSGHLVARYTLAVDRGRDRSGQQVTDFIRCQAWKERAEFARNYLHKGMKIAVRGSIVTGSYADRDGKTVYTTDINVESHYFCERKESSGGFIPPAPAVPVQAAPAAVPAYSPSGSGYQRQDVPAQFDLSDFTEIDPSALPV